MTDIRELALEREKQARDNDPIHILKEIKELLIEIRDSLKSESPSEPQPEEETPEIKSLSELLEDKAPAPKKTTRRKATDS